MPKLTKRIVDAAKAKESEYFIWDNDIPGFGLRVLPSGSKRYVVQYRALRRSRRISLGPSSVLTYEQVLWPEFEEVGAALTAYLSEITEKVIREEVHGEAGEADEVDEPRRMER